VHCRIWKCFKLVDSSSLILKAGTNSQLTTSYIVMIYFKVVDKQKTLMSNSLSTYHSTFLQVDESIKLMEEIEDIRKKKALAEIEYRNSMPASSYQQQKLRVCEVCSAYLGIHDNDRRLADHFGGKLHLGFIKIREKLENLMVSSVIKYIKHKNNC